MSSSRPRIAIAGFQHETNTFAPNSAGLTEFRMADSWPGLLSGEAVIEGTRGMNLPIAGAVTEATNVDLLPILWCAAEPSGPVTGEAFETIAEQMLQGIGDAMPVDGIYLDLHGAMVTAQFNDGEAELLRRIRELVGDKLPIAVSLDLHANVSQQMVNLATVMAVFRTYPHLDMAATGARCFRYLLECINGSQSFAALRQAPFLVPLHAQYTGVDPAKRLYDLVADNDSGAARHAELSMGFTAADVPDCGPSIVVYAQSPEQANSLADELIEAFIAAKTEFDIELVDCKQAVQQAMAATASVVIADVQDNAGAGGTADTMGIVHALLEAGADNAVVGVVCDAGVAARAHDVGVGGRFSDSLGAKSAIEGDHPYRGEFTVLALSDGSIRYQGEMYGGGTAEIGPSCLLEIGDATTSVRVVVSSSRIQCLDQAFFRHFGIALETVDIMVVKSTVHHRADFEALSDHFISAAAPGAFVCDLKALEYRQLRPGVEIL